MQYPIEDYISRDKLSPTNKQSLTAATGLDERSARSYVAAARRRGVPIIGLLSGGYYITSSPEEWRAFVEQERRRAVATFKRLDSFEAEENDQLLMLFEPAPAPNITPGNTPDKEAGEALG